MSKIKIKIPPAVSFAAIFYIVERQLSRAAAARAVRTLFEIFSPAACDAEVLRQAIDADLPDFEDAVQYFSAVHAGADCIVSRNPADFPPDPALPVLSPAEFLARVRAG